MESYWTKVKPPGAQATLDWQDPDQLTYLQQQALRRRGHVSTSKKKLVRIDTDPAPQEDDPRATTITTDLGEGFLLYPELGYREPHSGHLNRNPLGSIREGPTPPGSPA